MVNKVGGKNLSVFAGDISQNSFLGMQKKEDKGLFGKSPETASRVDAKRDEIKKKVMTVMGDQFKKDYASNEIINESYKKLDEYKGMLKEANEEIRKIHESQAAIRKEWGITEDSEECQDLEIMRKMRDKPGSLTKEERARAEQLETMPKTYYQEVCLANDEIEKVHNDTIEEAEAGIKAANATINGVKEAMLKQHGMADALKEMEDIEKAGADEIIGMLREAAMKHMEEEMKKLVEEAEKAAEEKAEQEEKTEEAKAKEAEQEGQTKEVTETIAQGESDMEKVQAEVSKILKDAELMEEDQKGLLVDKKL